MGVETVTTETITCDNPACPGNSLDPSSRTGWLFVQVQTQTDPPEGAPEGMPIMPVMTTGVFCSQACIAAGTGPVGEPA